jgi:hypothetical protein
MNPWLGHQRIGQKMNYSEALVFQITQTGCAYSGYMYDGAPSTRDTNLQDWGVQSNRLHDPRGDKGSEMKAFLQSGNQDRFVNLNLPASRISTWE